MDVNAEMTKFKEIANARPNLLKLKQEIEQKKEEMKKLESEISATDSALQKKRTEFARLNQGDLVSQNKDLFEKLENLTLVKQNLEENAV